MQYARHLQCQHRKNVCKIKLQGKYQGIPRTSCVGEKTMVT